jgi:hypothetical protein
VDFFYSIADQRHENPSLTFYLHSMIPNLPEMPRTSSQQEVEIITYPTKRQKGKAWHNGDWFLVQDDSSKLFYKINRRTRVIEMFAPHVDTLLRPFLRTLRTAVIPLLNELGYITLHSAALVKDCVAIALPGSQRAGKTTLLLEAIQAVNGEILAFDKLFVRRAGGGIKCCGEPGSFGVAIGTAKRLQLFLDHFPKDMSDLSWEESVAMRSPLAKARLTPSEVRRVVPPASNGPYDLAAVVFPSIERQGSTNLQELTSREAAAMMRQHFLFSRQYNPDWIKIHQPIRDASINADEVVEAVCTNSNLKFYSLTFGVQSTTEVVGTIIRALDSIRLTGTQPP